jgi:curved DNA-binding protein CbpA
MTDWEDYYEILGVDPEATEKEIQRAYRDKSFIFHPDRMAGAPASAQQRAQEEFKKVNRAYEVLGNPRKRIDYHFQWRERKRKPKETSIPKPERVSKPEATPRVPPSAPPGAPRKTDDITGSSSKDSEGAGRRAQAADGAPTARKAEEGLTNKGSTAEDILGQIIGAIGFVIGFYGFIMAVGWFLHAVGIFERAGVWAAILMEIAVITGGFIGVRLCTIGKRIGAQIGRAIDTLMGT